MSERWIEVVGWDRFQHYKDRSPAWIKLHTDLHASEEFLALKGHLRAVLVGIWIEYARSNGQLLLKTLPFRLQLRVTSQHIEQLNHAGFIRVVASKPLARRYSLKEERRERKHYVLPFQEETSAHELASAAHADVEEEDWEIDPEQRAKNAAEAKRLLEQLTGKLGTTKREEEIPF